ncbi:MAG TPA: HAMP domain-containing sensor histidine kinase [Gaiellaceae bacterium]|nr:HAMP domain-containing sensor histidine kinase [Gaiellaceae bacterium]
MLSRLSLRARLLLGVVLLAALGLAAADIATYSSLHSFLLSRTDEQLEAAHPAIESQIFGGPGGGPGAVGPQEGVDYYQLRTVAGRIFPGHNPFEHSNLPPPRLPKTITVGHERESDGDRVSYFSVPAVRGDGSYRVRASIETQHPGYVLVLAGSLAGVTSTLHRLLLIELIATGAVLAALAALALWVVRLGLRPLSRIEQTAAAITAGDLSHRVDHPDERTEVGRVGSALNTMLDRIETSDRRLRRFIADASHELRTPLAAVRAYAELFGRGAAARPEDLERSMSGIKREAERMSLLVDDLLLLARLDEGRPLERKPVDLAAVVEEAVDAARVVEPGRPIEVTVEPATVNGDAIRLRQVLDNLLANARAHTPAGTPVSVELRQVDGRAELTVADHGPGLSEEHASRVFERFYRADSSRARASGGAGLGLSIVSAVTEAHGGTAEVRPTPGGGATFVVTLPLDAEISPS